MKLQGSKLSKYFWAPENAGTLHKMAVIPKWQSHIFVKPLNVKVKSALTLWFIDLFQMHYGGVQRQNDKKYKLCHVPNTPEPNFSYSKAIAFKIAHLSSKPNFSDLYWNTKKFKQ